MILNEKIPDIELVAVIIGLVSAAIDNVPLVAVRPSFPQPSVGNKCPAEKRSSATHPALTQPLPTPYPPPTQATMGMYDLEQFPQDNPLWQVGSAPSPTHAYPPASPTRLTRAALLTARS